LLFFHYSGEDKTPTQLICCLFCAVYLVLGLDKVFCGLFGWGSGGGAAAARAAAAGASSMVVVVLITIVVVMGVTIFVVIGV
jgi:hypothetical protein